MNQFSNAILFTHIHNNARKEEMLE